ncbi:MAG: ATP-binding protein [Cyanobacteriota bacterium]
MNILNKLTILHRMLLGFILIFIVFVLFCVYTTHQINIIREQVHTIYKHPLKVSNAALEANINVIKIYRTMKDTILAENELEFETALNKINDRELDVIKHLDIIKENIIGNEGKKLEIDVRKLFENWKTLRDKEINLISNGKIKQARDINLNEEYKHTKLLESQLLNINKYSLNNTERFYQKTIKTQKEIIQTINRAIFGVATLAVIISLLIFFSIINDIKPLRDTMVKSTHSGDLKTIDVVGKNEITDITESYNLLINDIKNLIWLKEGLNKLNIALTGKSDSILVAESALNFLCRHVESGYGLFYKYDNEKQVCRLLSSFALPDTDEITKTYFSGEGIIGQVAKDQAAVLIDIADNSEFIIKSGLTERVPVNSYVFPLIDENNVVGIIEMASNNKYSKSEIAFLDASTDIISVSLASAIKSEKLNKLLKEYQQLTSNLQYKEEELTQQNEELQAKEEELMHQNEELQAKEEELMHQNEELQAKEEELIHQNEELNCILEQLKESEEKVRQSIEDLENSNLQLQEAHKHKNRFLSTMSHELRTPLNAILGFSQSLEKQYFGELNPKQLEYILMIYNSGQHLLGLINDILDIAKIDAGSMVLSSENISPHGLVEEVVALMSQQYKDKDIALKFNFAPGLKTFKADQQKCKQVLLNLLTNALKYTSHGGNVIINVESTESNIIFNVKDDGIGIRSQDLPYIFSEFYQSDRTRDQALGGIGIGLALCKRLVDMHNGQIGVESQENQGSNFWFSLPVENS